MHTPIALIIFNRPETTTRVFREIAKVKPRKLFVIADGPRPDQSDDAEKCKAARAVIDQVDWECDVLRDYSDANLGCGLRPASGISWVFEHVEEAIILEDDCVPHPTFFRFCEELLEKFRFDERIMHISGSNFQFRQKHTPYSYFFSCHNICWGWASWRRAWQYFDMRMNLWPALRDTSWLQDIVEAPRAVEYWKRMFEQAYVRVGEVDYWDYQWTFACWAQSGLSILPYTTLVSNIGFGEEATHTKSVHDRRANFEAAEIVFPLQHPSFIVQDKEADRHLIEQVVLPSLSPQRSLYHRLHRIYGVTIPVPVRKLVAYFLSKLRQCFKRGYRWK
jgi:hypothetical protein